MDEIELQRDWPRLRARLGRAFLNWPNVPNGSWKVEVLAPESQVEVQPKPGTDTKASGAAATDDLPLWRRKFRNE